MLKISTAARLLCLLTLASCGGDDDAAEAVAPDAAFSISAGPARAVAFQDSTRWIKVELDREGEFTEDVQVTLADAPEGVTGDAVTFQDETATLAFALTVGPDVPIGALSVTLTAASGDASTSAKLKLEVRAAEPTSREKIETALAAEEIDLGTALLYRCYARFGDDRLPKDLRGSGSDEDLMLARAIELASPELSADELTLLRPFTVRPHDPESIYQEAGKADRRARGAIAAPPPADCEGGNVWRSKRSSEIPLRVWIECGDELSVATGSSAIGRVLSVFEKLWPAMTGHMGRPILDAGGPDEGGDDAIDVYLVAGAITRGDVTDDIYRLFNIGVNAYTTWSPPYKKNSAGQGTSSAYMVFPRLGALSEKMRMTMTHEFFHVLQLAHHDTYNLAVAGNPYWFMDASATWASVHFDRKLSWPARLAAGEHQGRFGRFVREKRALNDQNGSHAYAAYIWPLFLEQLKGSPKVIAEMWDGLEGATSAADADSILDGEVPFAKNFHTFAVQNLNSSFEPGDPLPKNKRYVKLDNLFPDEVIQPIKIVATLGDYTKGLELPPLSATYFLFTVDDSDTRRIEFDFTGLQPAGALDVDALVHTADGWLEGPPLSFNGEGKVVFCFDKGESTKDLRGSFDAMELVLSNHEKRADGVLAGDLVVTSSSAPCSIWSGSTLATTDYTEVGGRYTQTITTTAVLEFDEETAMNSGSDEIPYRIRSGDYQSDFLYESAGIDPPCRTIETASGAMHFGLPNDPSPGSTSANLTLITDSQPATYFLSGFTWATITNTTNCNDSHQDETTTSVGPLYWLATGSPGFYTLQPDGVTAKDSADVPDPAGRGLMHFEWTFKKQDE